MRFWNSAFVRVISFYAFDQVIVLKLILSLIAQNMKLIENNQFRIDTQEPDVPLCHA